MEDSADGRAESEDKTSVTDLLLVQKRYVTDVGPQLTQLLHKCYVTEMIWYSHNIFSWTNIRMVLEFVLK